MPENPQQAPATPTFPGWRRLLTVLLSAAVIVMALQDLTGLVLGRRSTLKLGNAMSGHADVFQLRFSGKPPDSDRLQKQVRVYEDGRMLRGPWRTVGMMIDAGPGNFVTGKNIWARIDTTSGLDPAKRRFEMWVPQATPVWLRWIVYGLLVGIVILPWQRRYFLNNPTAKGKLPYLETVRGLACLLVVSTHFVGIFYPDLEMEVLDSSPGHGFEHLHRALPVIKLATGGGFAVMLFFLLSGFVLSMPFISKPCRDHGRFVQAILRRPVRLLGIVWAGMILQQFLMMSGLLYGAYHTPPKPFGAFFRDLINVYGSCEEYCAVFWTIKIELWGSLGVYLFCWLFHSLRWRWLGYAAGLFLFRGSLYQCFVWGVLLADVWQQGHETWKSSAWSRLSPLFLAVGLVLAGFTQDGSLRGGLDEWLFLRLPQITSFIGGGYNTMGGILILMAVLSWRPLQETLGHSWLVFVGRISYAIYGVHGMLLSAVGPNVFLWMRPSTEAGKFSFHPDGTGYHLAVIATLVIYVIIVMMVSCVLTAGVDEPFVRLARWMADQGSKVIFGKRLRIKSGSAG